MPVTAGNNADTGVLELTKVKKEVVMVITVMMRMVETTRSSGEGAVVPTSHPSMSSTVPCT